MEPHNLLPPLYLVWMDELTQRIYNRMGLHPEDLPDFCFRDYFEDGMTPEQALEEIQDELMDNGYFDSSYTQDFDEYSDADPGL